jgi:hypothetical protein
VRFQPDLQPGKEGEPGQEGCRGSKDQSCPPPAPQTPLLLLADLAVKPW